ncbi:hypothetical protein CKAH01_15485 [Colletotrichum kahawae]|uniref:Uncharacterized protein n=1 Tax=Colletotrichum kahawae TaxID=34407 RepID=A0AAD9YH90_COLKA|nr:hypothetical protein CKAH01_15485 [Colletotrichum kahawae]
MRRQIITEASPRCDGRALGEGKGVGVGGEGEESFARSAGSNLTTPRGRVLCFAPEVAHGTNVPCPACVQVSDPYFGSEKKGHERDVLQRSILGLKSIVARDAMRCGLRGLDADELADMACLRAATMGHVHGRASQELSRPWMRQATGFGKERRCAALPGACYSNGVFQTPKSAWNGPFPHDVSSVSLVSSSLNGARCSVETDRRDRLLRLFGWKPVRHLARPGAKTIYFT